MGDFVVAPASVADMGLIADWAAAEGWNPGLGDERLFFPVDPEGFLVGRLDGRPVSSISAIRYGVGHGFIGLHLTVPEQRGLGYGRRTWQAGLQRLTNRNVGFDGAVTRRGRYRESGFRHYWDTHRFRGVARVDGAPAGTAVVDARQLGFDRLTAYDQRFFPTDRSTFLALWISAPRRRALAALRDGALVGLGVRRPAGDVFRIGPLYADSPGTARLLLEALTSGDEDDRPDEIILDVPDLNRDGIALAEQAGLTPIFETARMYTGDRPEIDVDGIYSVASLELG
ncbi:GNAT family N-acetyltransferase [Actinoplanes regularis]|uniref:GNAT family N-acetyltransferase n=1 Tax=Actinoplanes regularis TaxID=52697 RepID=UPI0024A0A1DC|nr:GNAT family N-acetyltransferase [Actinoplanes regularis]GLW32635.1 acetyltransferase [Actinoplanes regularis]